MHAKTSEKINEEVMNPYYLKEILENHKCYTYSSDVLMAAALSYIRELEKDRRNLLSELNHAVEDMKMLGRMGQNICPVCAHYNHGEGSKTCITCPKMDNFEWRGVQEGD